MDPRIANAVLDHIKEHVMLKEQVIMDPILSSIAGLPPPAPAPTEGGPPPDEEPKGSGPVEGPAPDGAELPSLPKNPLTGEEAQA